MTNKFAEDHKSIRKSFCETNICECIHSIHSNFLLHATALNIPNFLNNFWRYNIFFFFFSGLCKQLKIKAKRFYSTAHVTFLIQNWGISFLLRFTKPWLLFEELMKHTVFHAPECPLIELRCLAVSTPVDNTPSEHLTRRDNINSVPEDIADIKLIARSYAPTSRRDVRVSWTTW